MGSSPTGGTIANIVSMRRQTLSISLIIISALFLGGCSSAGSSQPDVPDYPVASDTSVKQIAVEALAWYCPEVPNNALETSRWTLSIPFEPYELWTSGFSGVLYLQVAKSSGNLVSVKAITGRDYLEAWGCPNNMLK